MHPGALVYVVGNTTELGFLLDRIIPTPAGFAQRPGWQHWHAWMLDIDTAHAGLTDVLIEPDDLQATRRFGMVQTWNGIDLELPMTNLPDHLQIVGRLPAARLTGMRAVAREWQISKGRETRIDPELDSLPGLVGLRDTLPGVSVLTGTPVVTDAATPDIRVAYRLLFRSLALAIRDSLRHAAACTTAEEIALQIRPTVYR